MKKIVITTLGSVKFKFNQYLPSLFVHKDNQWYFVSKYTGMEEVEIALNNIEYKEFYKEEATNFFVELFHISMEEAQTISKEPVGPIKIRGGEYDLLFSFLQKYSYNDNSENLFFEFARDIFIRVLTGHILGNGNKRTAVVFLKYVLKTFGFYFKWTESNYKNYSVYEDIIENFIKRLHSTNSVTEIENTREEVLNWIKGNTLVDLSFK